MRLLAAVTILFFLLPTNLVSTQDKAKPDNPQRDAGGQPAPQQPPSTTVEVNVGYPNEAVDRQPAKQETKKESAPMTSFEWIISVITFVYSAFSVLTFFAIKRQAEIANQGTQALIASERAWVTATIEWSPGYSGLYMGSHTEKEVTTHGYSCNVRLTYKNDGRTPAWVTEWRACLRIFDTLPVKPPLQYAKAIKHGIESLAPEQSRPFDTPLFCDGEQTLDNLAVIYGVVKYRTAFGGIAGETVFGYSVTLDGKTVRPLENPEWNKNS
jgi:hypothetical protein